MEECHRGEPTPSCLIATYLPPFGWLRKLVSISFVTSVHQTGRFEIDDFDHGSVLQFESEFRRFSLSRDKIESFNEFYSTVATLHRLPSESFFITYTDPEGDLLPINNNDNFKVAVANARPLLRLHVQLKGYLPVNVFF